MNFQQCLDQFNWFTVIVICILSSAIELIISIYNSKKMHKELMKELQEIKRTEKMIEEFKNTIENNQPQSK